MNHDLATLTAQVDQLQSKLDGMQTTLDAIADAIAWVNATDQVVWCNAAFTQLVARSAQAVMGCPFDHLLPLSSAAQPLATVNYPHRQIQAGRHTAMEYVYQRQQEDRWLLISGCCIASESVVALVIRDVTQERAEEQKQKQIETTNAQLMMQLHVQRQRLETIISSVPGVVWEAWGCPDERSQQIDFVSDYVETMLGYNVDQWLSIPNFWLTIVHPEDQERAGREAAAIFNSRQGGKSQFRWVAKDGRIVWVLAQSAVICDQQGQPIGMRGVNLDITDRKQAEEALQQQEKQLRATLDVLPDRMFRQRIDGTYLDCKGNFEHSIVGTPEQLIGQNMLALPIPNAVKQGLLQRFQQAVETGELQTYEHELERPDGLHHYEARIVKSGADEVVCMVRDVSDRKQAEAALRASEAQYRDLVETANCIIVRWNTQGNIRFLNNYGQRFLGFTADEIVGRSIIGTMVPEQESSGRDLQSLMQNICQQPENYLLNENENICKNGDRVWVVWSNKPVFDEQGNLIEILSVGTDATERRQAQADLENSLSLLQATFESIQDGILAIGRTGDIVSYNSRFLEMWSVTREILEEPDWNSRINYLANQLQEPEAFFRRVKELYQTPEAESYDLLELKDGRVFERYSRPQWVGDTIVGRVWNFRDITARKQSEAALRLSELKYRNIFENSQVGIGRTRIEDGLFVDANQRCAEIMGYRSAADLIGQCFSTEFYVNPEERQRMLAEVQRVGEVHDFEMCLRRVDGSIRWGLLSLRLNSAEQCLDFVITDISDRKRLEEELSRSQQFLNSIIDNIPLAIFVKDVNRDFRYALINKSSEKILGFPRETAFGLNDYDLLSQDQAAFHRQEDLAAIAKGSALEIPEQWINKNSDERMMVRGWKLPLFNAQGHATHIMAISEDITDRKHREQALRLIMEGTASQTGDEFFRAFVRSLAEVLQVRYVLVTEIADSSRTRVRTLAVWGQNQISDNFEYDVQGTPCERVMQDRICYYPKQVQSFFPEDFELTAMGAESFLGVPLTNSEGQTLGHLAVLDVKPMKDDPGRELILQIFAARAGAELERKQADEALQHRAKTNSLLSSLSRQFLDQEIDTAINFTMQAVARFIHSERCCIFEYSEDQSRFSIRYEWCAEDVQPLMARAGDDAIEVFYWFNQQILSGEVVQIENMADLPAEAAAERETFLNESIQSLIAVPMIHLGKVVGFVGADVVHFSKKWSQDDVNLLKLVGELIAIGRTRHQAEAALRVAKEAAEAANRAKSIFLANMSHELRTPLNAILGFTQLMERDIALTTRQRDSLAIINRSGEHLLDLINDVLEMSKIEAGRIVLNPESFDLHGLLQSLQELFQMRAAAKHLSLCFEWADDLPQYVLTDEGKLRQVLINLLSNAVKFTPSGSITLRARLHRSFQEDGSPPCCLYFEVEDTGCGIAPEEIEHLFRPFVQTTSGTQAREGTGLGLTISRQFVQLMGGEIDCRSTLGQGSAFWFTVQVDLAAPSDAVPQPLRQGRVVGLAPGQPACRILIVDDRQENRDLIQQLLELVGFETRTANDGQEAIAQWQTWHPHLIWMDMRMPVLNGYEATQRIRLLEQQQASTEERAALASPTVIIALTASAFEEQRATILAAGCDDLVRKPFREQVIFDKIAEHVGVQYLYSGGQMASLGLKPPQTAQRLTELDLTVMPPSWIAAVHQAALEVDADQLLKLIQQVPITHAELAERLTDMVHQFCFDELFELTLPSIL